MKTTAEMIEVMQAFERGEIIEVKLQYSGVFTYAGSTIAFDWQHNDYRIAEKPKKMVKMWLWLFKDSGGAYLTTRYYYAEQPQCSHNETVIGKIESSMIEVEE